MAELSVNIPQVHLRGHDGTYGEATVMPDHTASKGELAGLQPLGTQDAMERGAEFAASLDSVRRNGPNMRGKVDVNDVLRKQSNTV